MLWPLFFGLIRECWDTLFRIGSVHCASKVLQNALAQAPRGASPNDGCSGAPWQLAVSRPSGHHGNPGVHPTLYPRECRTPPPPRGGSRATRPPPVTRTTPPHSRTGPCPIGAVKGYVDTPATPGPTVRVLPFFNCIENCYRRKQRT